MKTEIAYNKISDKLKKLIVWPKAPDGKPEISVIYRTTHNEQMIQRTADDERVRVDTYPPIHIPNMDTILDPDTGDYVQLAYFKTLLPPSPNTGGVVAPALLPITFATDGAGFLHIPYANGAGMRLYEFMELTNANKDCVNPAHEPNQYGMPYLFYRVKPEATAELLIDKMAETARVSGLILVMEDEVMRKLAPKLKISGQLAPKQLMGELLKKAQEDPYLVNDMLDSEQTKIEAEVRRAIGRKVIEFSENEQAFLWYETQAPLALIPSSVVDKVDALVTFLASGVAGRQVRDKIREGLGKSKVSKDVATAPEESFYDEDDEVPAAVSTKKAAKAAPKKPAAAKPARKPPVKKSAAPAPAPAPAGEGDADPDSY